MSASRSRRARGTGYRLALLTYLVPLGASVWSIFSRLPEVLATGMCPGAPPDVPAYACTVEAYLLRMTLGPWALMGHLTIWFGWTGLIILGGLAGMLFARARSSGPRPVS